MVLQAPSDTTFEPVVRFSIRRVLAVTAIVAVFAATGSAFFRSQSPSVQESLLTCWGITAASAPVSVLIEWRRKWRPSRTSGPVRCVLHWAPPRFWGAKLVRTEDLALLLGAWILLSFISMLVAADGAAHGRFKHLVLSLAAGTILGRYVLRFVMNPVLLCVNGVLSAGRFTPWSRIRSAEWAWSRPGTLRLHRLDGDTYAVVSPDLQTFAEAFLCSKTQFILRRFSAEAAINGNSLDGQN